MSVAFDEPGQLGQGDLLAELEHGVAAAADQLADLSALYERLGPYCASTPPGAYARIRVVRPAREWAPTVHAMIDVGDLDQARGRRVSRAYLHRLVDELAEHADWSTGRNCMPGHHQLGARLGRAIKPGRLAAMAVMSAARREQEREQIARNRAKQVGNAIEVLIGAGLLSRVEQGRLLDLTERLEQWANGCDRRVARAVYALTVPHLQPLPTSQAVDNHPAVELATEAIFAPPQSGSEKPSSSSSVVAFPSLGEISESEPGCAPSGQGTARLTAAQEPQVAASRRPPAKNRRLWELEAGLYALVLALRSALPLQLGGVSVRKLAGSTKRFYEAGWDALGLAGAIVDSYDMRGRRFPAYRPGNPAKWLGWVLKSIDHTVTPAMRRYDAFTEQADTEPCAHDWPGGARLSIVTGAPKCPLCRHAFHRTQR